MRVKTLFEFEIERNTSIEPTINQMSFHSFCKRPSTSSFDDNDQKLFEYCFKPKMMSHLENVLLNHVEFCVIQRIWSFPWTERDPLPYVFAFYYSRIFSDALNDILHTFFWFNQIIYKGRVYRLRMKSQKEIRMVERSKTINKSCA